MLNRVTGHRQDVKAAFLGQVPQGRAGHPREIADVIVVITSPQASFRTGQTIVADGGVTAG